MLTKNKRIVDKKAILKVKIFANKQCEYCKQENMICNIHHIKSKGSGGHDVIDNLICLCYVCHEKVHKGLIKRELLKDIVFKRRWSTL